PARVRHGGRGDHPRHAAAVGGAARPTSRLTSVARARGGRASATFVLVHGGFHGGWCWRRVTPLLRAAGHEVYTPTLTGLGERAHLARPEVSLHTHVQDVLGVLAYEDVQGVVLVGWSYAGMVITAVAEQAADRLAHLVYLDASVPEDGQAALDLLDPATRAAREERVRMEGEGWQMLP